MYEKVSPMHPDKIADRIAGALVDLAYDKETDPKIAVEVLIGHGICTIIAETSVHITDDEAEVIVHRIAENTVQVNYIEVPQDKHLADNQKGCFRCGDNGIFRGVPFNQEHIKLRDVAMTLYANCGSDGKYIIDGDRLIICQSNAKYNFIETLYPNAEINPLGYWTGGINVDTGAVNRKLGSDMGDAVTGGGLHGKDLSKADVSINIYAHLKAVYLLKPVEIVCAIGDEMVDGKPYSEIVEIARDYINKIGGFEKFAEWGFIRP